jgi:hypothetical protein
VLGISLATASPAQASVVSVAAGDIARNSLATPQQQTAGLVSDFAPTAVFAAQSNGLTSRTARSAYA